MFRDQDKNICVCTSLAGASSPGHRSVNRGNAECHQYVQQVRATVLMRPLGRGQRCTKSPNMAGIIYFCEGNQS